jgi:hypothetical protein
MTAYRARRVQEFLDPDPSPHSPTLTRKMSRHSRLLKLSVSSFYNIHNSNVPLSVSLALGLSTITEWESISIGIVQLIFFMFLLIVRNETRGFFNECNLSSIDNRIE